MFACVYQGYFPREGIIARRHGWERDLLNFEPHEYITNSKKIYQNLRAREKEFDSPMRSICGSPETDALASYYTVRRKMTTLVFACCEAKITPLLCD